MSNQVNTFKVSSICATGASASEAAEGFVMENHSLVQQIERGLIIDPSDVDYALQVSFNKANLTYRGGYRSFRANFYKELEKWYGVKLR